MMINLHIFITCLHWSTLCTWSTLWTWNMCSLCAILFDVLHILYTVEPLQTRNPLKPNDFVNPKFLSSYLNLPHWAENFSKLNFLLSLEGVWFRGVPLYMYIPDLITHSISMPVQIIEVNLYIYSCPCIS